MARFTYSALSSDGQRVTGVRRARTLGDARREITARGLHTVTLSERPRRWDVALTREHVDRRRLQQLLRQLDAFVRSGIPLLDALQVLVDEADDALVRRTVLHVIEDLRAGRSLASALGDRPELLREHHVGLIRAAEASGRLAEALTDIETDVTRDVEMRRSVGTALAYPLFVIILTAVTIGILAVVVLPRFEQLFRDLDADPPAMTRYLLGAVHVVSSIPTTGWLTGAGVAVVVGVGIGHPRSRPLRHRVVLALPVIGSTVRLGVLERLCRVLGVTLRSGVPLPVAVATACEALGNTLIRRRMETVRERILAGQGLSRALSDADVLTPAVRQMVAVGEATGTLEVQLGLAADYLHDELTRRIGRATALLEPLMIVVVGVVVGLVAIALVSAMYGLISDIGATIPSAS